MCIRDRTYTVTVKAKKGGTTDWSETADATITYTNPCLTATFTPTSLQPMTTSVLVQAASGPFYATQNTNASDSVSDTLNTGPSCESYSYSIISAPTTGSTSAPLTEADLTIDASGQISLYTTNSAAVEIHTATITIGLAATSYASVPKRIITFQITIEACKVTSFTMNGVTPA